MLSYALAIAVAFSSLVFFSTAFLMSDIHRQDDFLWSGVGLFYALVLWFCARNITGAVLLGQTAAATLLVSYGWQTLKLRKAVANPEQAAVINNFSLLKATNGLLNRQKVKSQPEAITPYNAVSEKVTDKPVAIPNVVAPASSAKKSNKTKSGRLGSFFGKQQKSNIANTKPDEILEAKTPQKNDNDTTKSAAVTRSKTDKLSMSEKVDPTQSAEENIENINAAKSSIAPELEPQEIEEPLTKSQSSNDSDIPIPEVTQTDSTANSVDSVSKPETKSNNQPVVVNPEVENNIPGSSVIPENKPQTSSQAASEVEDNQIENKNPAEFTNKLHTESITEDSVDTSNSNILEPKLSVLDSLETVEVAEVLDALPENAENNRDQGEENIIEVPTTEISEIITVSEVNNIRESQDNEANTETK